MDVQDAIQQAQAHIQNAMDQLKQPLVKEDLLYQWDNQIGALDAFLAESELLANPLLDKARGSMRTVKKQLTDAVLSFEAKQEGVDLEDEEPSDEEWADGFVEQAFELLEMVKEAIDEKVADVQELWKWEEPMAALNGFLADSEPYQELNAELKKVRSVVRAARKDLSGRLHDAIGRFKGTDDGDDDED